MMNRTMKIDFDRFVDRKLAQALRGETKLVCPRGNSCKVGKALGERGVIAVAITPTQLQVVRVECPTCKQGITFHPSGKHSFCRCGLKEIKGVNHA